MCDVQRVLLSPSTVMLICVDQHIFSSFSTLLLKLWYRWVVCILAYRHCAWLVKLLGFLCNAAVEPFE